MKCRRLLIVSAMATFYFISTAGCSLFSRGNGEDKWMEYTAAGGSFTVRFPGDTLSFKKRDDKNYEATHITASSGKGTKGAKYTVIVFQLKVEKLDEFENVVLNNLADQLIKQITEEEGEIISDKEIDLNGHKVRELICTGIKDGKRFKCKMIISGPVIYWLVVETNEGEDYSADTGKFFDSFTLDVK